LLIMTTIPALSEAIRSCAMLPKSAAMMPRGAARTFGNMIFGHFLLHHRFKLHVRAEGVNLLECYVARRGKLLPLIVRGSTRRDHCVNLIQAGIFLAERLEYGWLLERLREDIEGSGCAGCVGLGAPLAYRKSRDDYRKRRKKMLL
jgi:hypothetical protein